MGMRNYITFDGQDLSDYGVYISGTGVFSSPERTYETIDIPGRDGVLIGRDVRLDNIELTYPAFVYSNFREAITRVKGLLLSRTGYRQIRDTYYPEEFRMGYFAGPLEVEPTAVLDAGNFDLTFICKPQRYLLSGTISHEYTSTGYIENPTEFPSQPLITIYGTGSVTVGGVTITTGSEDAYTVIDCEAMNAYYGRENRNNTITLSGNNFPTIPAGRSDIIIDGPSQVLIIPRWWQV